MKRRYGCSAVLVHRSREPESARRLSVVVLGGLDAVTRHGRPPSSRPCTVLRVPPRVRTPDYGQPSQHQRRGIVGKEVVCDIGPSRYPAVACRTVALPRRTLRHRAARISKQRARRAFTVVTRGGISTLGQVGTVVAVDGRPGGPARPSTACEHPSTMDAPRRWFLTRLPFGLLAARLAGFAR